MRRVTAPLGLMGARFEEENGDGLPIVVHGGTLKSLEYDSPTGSAQVKGALLFAGLVGGVPVKIREPVNSRDHSERMLRALGVRVVSDGTTVRLTPPESIPPFEAQIPADPSSAEGRGRDARRPLGSAGARRRRRVPRVHVAGQDARRVVQGPAR